MSDTDLRQEIFTAGIGLPVRVRVTHVPTGVTGEATHLSVVVARQQAREALWEARIAFLEEKLTEARDCDCWKRFGDWHCYCHRDD